MTAAAQSPSRRPTARGLALLVLAVLAGVLAMHGLGPAPVSAKASASAASHVMVTSPDGAGHAAAGDCSHTAGGTGHANHADATCAAAGVGVSYAPPALASALDVTPAVVARPAGAAGAPESGRAPPDLAELQLLRI
nr:DUF6153 family protein [Streptomyces sp. ISL-66]